MLGTNNPLISTYDFMRDVIGYDLAAFFDRNCKTLRTEIDTVLNRNFNFELPLHPKTYASYPVVSTANSSGLFEVVVRHILAVLRSRCAGFGCPACLAADTYPARPLLST